jgi:hypothetical protein
VLSKLVKRSKLNCFDFDSNCIVKKRNVISNDEFSVPIRTKIESESIFYSNACDINRFICFLPPQKVLNSKKHISE